MGDFGTPLATPRRAAGDLAIARPLDQMAQTTKTTRTPKAKTSRTAKTTRAAATKTTRTPAPKKTHAATAVVCLLTLTGLLGALPSLAQANSAWWHVLSGARPTYLKALHGTNIPGVPGVNEVQEIAIGPDTFTEVTAGGQEVGYFETQPGPFGGVQTPPTVENVRAGLEGVYGAHNVEVTLKSGGVAEPVLLVTFVGADADKTVTPLEAKVYEGYGTTAEAKVVTPAKAAIPPVLHPDGTVVATVLNIGDASAGECIQVAAGAKGKFKNSECTEAAEPGHEEFEQASPVKIVDKLPPGVKAVSVKGGVFRSGEARFYEIPGSECQLDGEPGEATVVSCTITDADFNGPVPGFSAIEVRVGVVVTGHVPAKGEGVNESEANEVSVSGGDAAPASVSRPVKLSEEPVPFGIENYELTPEGEGGKVDTQAGSHPFQTTFTFGFNQLAEGRATSGLATGNTAELPRDVNDELPPGLIGNPQPFARCTSAEFLSAPNQCPAASVVGAVITTVSEPHADGIIVFPTPLFNLEPSVGEPAKFGFLPENNETPIYINTSVRTGGDYGIDGEVSNITQSITALSSVVTFWGVPGAPAHDGTRDGCLVTTSHSEYPACEALVENDPPPFFELPTSCTGPLQSSVEMDSWENSKPIGQRSVFGPTQPLPALDGCGKLPFNPSITAEPDGKAASSSTGFNVDVHVPQEASLNASGLGEGEPRNITVTLPEGVAVNPSGGDGLEACSDALVGFQSSVGEGGFAEPPLEPGVKDPIFSATPKGPAESALPGVNTCPSASKIGKAKIKTPLLKHELEGFVYLASQNSNPFGSLIAMYIVVEDPESGVLIKLAGQVHLSATGQIETTFDNSPQAPFEDAVLEFFGGERAPLATPARCGTYTTSAVFTPWSQEAGEEPHHASATFGITEGPNHSACPGASLPFNPSLTGGATNIQAGAFTPLTATFGREDGEQQISRVRFTLPPGLSGILTHVELCGEQQANEGKCPPESLIGEATVSAGVGSDPVSVTGGKIYLTGPYHGAPFGLSVVDPVKAGPFDLERDTSNPNQDPACDCIVVRGKIEINPITSALTITTNSESEGYAIPHLIDGIPVQLKRINAITTRSDFQFNPTNCAQMPITGVAESAEGASRPVEVPFQATNCATLKFEPKFKVSVTGKNSRAGGAALTTKVEEPKGSFGNDANITKVKVELPKQLPSRLTTLQKACTDKQFEANPANCPKDSKIGYAVVHTPLIPVPLQGPAIFVSHGGEAFPSLTLVLQGYGITIDLVGTTFISKTSITSTTFKTVPDQPFSSFELTLPQGKFSALSTDLPHESYDLCGQKLVMPNEFIAQNGAEIKQSTAISVSGCGKALTRAQKLAAALKSCHKDHRKSKREKCEAAARKKYGPLKKAKKGKQSGGK
jgi:hypothetical protein